MDFFDQILSLFADFLNPKKRVFYGYLFLALIIALVWLVAIRKNSIKAALGKVFDRKVFFSPSALADYKIYLINRVFTLFVSPLLISQLAIATSLYYLLHDIPFLQRNALADTPTGIIVALFTLTIFTVDDFTKFLLHRWMHRWPILWAIHKVHHSAETMTPITVYRIHPLEGILYGLRGAVAQGTTMAVFFFLFGNAVDIYTVVGVNILSFLFHVTGSNLRHSHIQISYWAWLEHLVISPSQHQIHHSVASRHHDKNFGVALAIWDWLFGSLYLSEPDRELTFGLGTNELHASRLSDIYFHPFRDMYRVVRRRIPTMDTTN
ncbi:MAG: sterol desaturase [Proteobacteria bacterium]|nr:MAG: sterol desaturase [Pseudomonadota bacterium]PIE40596.1 MAG: sterol desaturase [Gammaproteobacteria bacterium]